LIEKERASKNTFLFTGIFVINHQLKKMKLKVVGYAGLLTSVVVATAIIVFAKGSFSYGEMIGLGILGLFSLVSGTLIVFPAKAAETE
jgi:hypothetical protein